MHLRPDRMPTAGSLLVPTDEERAEIDARVPRSQAWQGNEHEEQKHLITLVRLRVGAFPELSRLFAVPNGGHRNAATAGKMKAEGQKSGVPDLFLPVRRDGAAGLWVEMKTAKGSVSPNQWDWMTFLHRAGYRVRLCNCPERALSILTDYLEP